MIFQPVKPAINLIFHFTLMYRLFKRSAAKTTQIKSGHFGAGRKIKMTYVLSLPYEEDYVIKAHLEGLQKSGKDFRVEPKVEKLPSYVTEHGNPALIICDYEHLENLTLEVRKDLRHEGPLRHFKEIPMIVIFHGPESLVHRHGFNIVEIYQGHQSPKNIKALVDKHYPQPAVPDQRPSGGEPEKPKP